MALLRDVEDALRETELPQAARQAGDNEAHAEKYRTNDDRHQHAETVREPAHHHAAKTEAHHRERVAGNFADQRRRANLRAIHHRGTK